MNTRYIIADGERAGRIDADGELTYEYDGGDPAVEDALEAAAAAESVETGYGPAGQVTEAPTEADPEEAMEAAIQAVRSVPGHGTAEPSELSPVPGDEPSERNRVGRVSEAPEGAVVKCDDGGLYYTNKGIDEADHRPLVEVLNDPDEPTTNSLALKGQWIPYEGPRGGRGWKDTETGEVVYQDEAPGLTVGDTPDDNPMSEGDVVMLEYDGDRHYGRVVAEAGDGSVRVRDDRNVWTLEPDEPDPYGGDMHVVNLGDPESDQQDPDEVPLEDPDDIAYAIDNQDTLDGSLDKAAEALAEGAGTDSVYQALQRSSELNASSATDMMMNTHGVGETEAGSVGLDAGQGDRRELGEAFADALDDKESSAVMSAVSGWTGMMYQDERTAPLIQAAMEDTGNETMPEYAGSQSAAMAGVDEADKEAVRKASEFTTERLREAFGDEVAVFRGMSETPHQGTPSEGTGIAERLSAASKESFDDLKEGDLMLVEDERMPGPAVAEYRGGDDASFDAELVDRIGSREREYDGGAAVFGEGAEIEHRPAESWSLNPETARLYAGSGAVVQTTIDVEDAMVSSSTGGISPTEEDTVVRHDGPAEYDSSDIYDMSSGDSLEHTSKMRLEAIKGAMK